MDIGEADATGRDLDDDLIVALGNGDLDLVEVQGSIALVQPYCQHPSLLLRGAAQAYPKAPAWSGLGVLRT